MARYDQVEPHVGIVRAPLAANLTLSGAGEFGPKAVSLNAQGRVVVGTAGTSGLAGVLVKNVPVAPAGRFSAATVINDWMGARAGDVVDIMTQGQILDANLPAGAAIYATPAGDLVPNDEAAGANFKVGYTVEANRLVVKF